jgi:UDP-glucose:(heptosyl)LPS alpha-1,3-glucosyltransferase
VGEIAAELARRGHDVTVICRQGRQPDATGAVKVMALGPAGGFLRSLALPRFASAVGEAARRGVFDIVHATLPIPAANIYQPRGGTVAGQIQAKRRRLGALGRAWYDLTRGFNLDREIAGQYEGEIAADSPATCLCVSPMVAREFAAFHRRATRVRVVFNGVDIPTIAADERAKWRADLRAQWGADAATPVFLTVAENFRLKGVAEAIAALGDFARAGGRARLVVAGGADAGPYRKLAAGAGVADRVEFTGHVESVFPLYSAADAVVLLSWYDACSRVVLEALRWGVPSITTRYNGAAELPAEGAVRVVESPRDRAGVVAAMGELADPARRQAMADACRKLADWAALARQVDELEQVYREVAGE